MSRALSPSDKGLVDWTIAASVSRPDLGPAEAFYLTASSFEAAMGKSSLPVPLDSPDLARVVLMFGGLLPPQEASLLVNRAAELGVADLATGLNTPAEVAVPAKADPAAAPQLGREPETTIDVGQRTRSTPSATILRPLLEASPNAASLRLPTPPRSAALSDMLAELAAAANLAAWAEGDLRSRPISAEVLLSTDEESLEDLISSVRRGRASAAALRSTVVQAQAFARNEVIEAANSLGFALPASVVSMDLSADTAAEIVTKAGSIAALARIAEPDRVSPDWIAKAAEAPSLNALHAALEALSVEQALHRAKSERRAAFVSLVHTFLLNTKLSVFERLDWLQRLTVEEVAVVLRAIDPQVWPVAAAVLARLAVDAGPDGRTALEALLAETAEASTRRDLLNLVDPGASGLDDHPGAQRFVVAEQFRDVLAFGPLVLMTDPTYRFTDHTLVGAAVANLVGIIVRNLDLLDAPGELKRLAAGAVDDTGADRKDSSAALLEYAATPSTSAGFYLQLREAVRERHFLPLLVRGSVDEKAACEAARVFDVEAAIETAVEDVRRDNPRAVHIEARHRARILRYVATGRDLLTAFARSAIPHEESRRAELGKDVREALSHLNRFPSEPGSSDWLENEIASMIEADDGRLEAPTLRGGSMPLFEQNWTPADTVWAQHSTDLPEFYLTGGQKTATVALGALSDWARGRRLGAGEILEDLVARDRFAAAVAFAEEADATDDERNALRQRARDAGIRAAEPLRRRLAQLNERYDSEAVTSLASVDELSKALDAFELQEAAEQLDFLEMEAAELVEMRRRNALDVTQAAERTALLRQLLKAGVAGPDERWNFDDLKGRWEAELRVQMPERVYRRAIEKALDVPESLKELTGDIEAFSRRSLDPDSWLRADRAKDFEVFLEAPAEKLRTWLRISGQLDAVQRRALAELVRWFVGFVEGQAAGLRALDDGQPSDPLLEQVLEVGEAIEQASDPVSCAADLGVIEVDADPAEPVLAASQVPAVDDTPTVLIPLIERGDWRMLADAARDLRLVGDDDDAKRMTEVAEFAGVLAALGAGAMPATGEELVTAARVLGAGGHLVGRALPSQRLLAIAFRIVAAALIFGEDAPDAWPEVGPDGSWSVLLRHGLQPALTEQGFASRVVEQLCSGALGREVVNRIWDAPTSRSEPGPSRAALLAFLYDRGLSDHLLFLAGRHEPAIRARLGQLLDLRAIAGQRPDLVPVSEAVASQVSKAAQGVPFRTFIAGLPSAVQDVGADLVVTVDNDILLRVGHALPTLAVTLSIEPRGMVPEFLEAVLFHEDDVTFEDGSRRRRLSDQPVYFASQWSVDVRFGSGWADPGREGGEAFRIRVNAKVLTGELVSKDVVCQLTRTHLRSGVSRRIDDETLLDAFPGVENTPALGETFIGRHEELERLHGNLIQARRPSPVLLTGMRRIGKTSLLYAFHARHRQPRRDEPITVYLSIAERRAALMDRNRQVGSVIYSAIVQALGKKHFSSTDHNRELGERLRQRLGSDRDAVRNTIAALSDPESLTDSLLVLSESLLDWAGGATRVVYLIDEAETLVLPFHGGETKRLELEQFMQALREVSQTSSNVGLLLSGSNHIAEFARSYKNAFFGSSLQIDLAGMTDRETASKLVSPGKLTPYLEFKGEPVDYAIDMCAGMPQFLWQLGATVAALVRSGPVTTADVRHGVAALVGERSTDLPFNAYDVLEPVEHMLGLAGPREQDLLWLLLWRVANSSSLVVKEANQSFIIDQSLLELDELEGWKVRLLSLVSLEILEMPKASTFRFRVPIFAEGFRAPRQRHAYQMRHQRAST